MGQFAKDWESLKTLIRQKDDAIDRASAQIATQTQQIAQLQKQLAAAASQFDSADQKAASELRQVIADNNTPAPAAAPAPQSSAPAMTTFTK